MAKRKMLTKPLHWLHLSDIHMGCRGTALWWQVRNELRDSLKKQIEKIGHSPDLILITGDLAFKGAKKEYVQFDSFLEDLKDWLSKTGAKKDLLILPVPGNHDFKRPTGQRAYQYKILDGYNSDDDPLVKDFKKRLWSGKNTPTFIKNSFNEYTKWFDRTIKPQFDGTSHEAHFSRIPGDCCVEVNFDNHLPLIVVGLNSAWMQYTGGDFKKRLELPREQFHLALSGDDRGSPLCIFDDERPALLMMHHPPAWLSETSRNAFFESIYTPDRFHLCLFGHRHKGRSETRSDSGGEARYFFQSPSLFGLEHYGTSKEDRAMGCSFGRITSDGEIRIWPMERRIQGGGEANFVPDSRFKGVDKKEGILVRPADTAKPAENRSKDKKKQPDPTIDLTVYLKDLQRETGFIKISGIGSGAGKAKTASRYSIEHLYTPLRSRVAMSEVEGSEDLKGAIGRGEMTVALRAVLPQHRKLFIEGQPGAGKTTFLKLVASCLARDGLGIECHESVPWRKHHLGLDSGAPPTPIFLKVADLVPLLNTNSRPGCRDDRFWFIELLETRNKNSTGFPSRDYWIDQLERGRALLLVDGLDESGDERIRERVLEILHDACEHWGESRIVVSSRPIQAQSLEEMGFHHTVIESFGDEEITRFIDQWIAALYEDDPGDTPGKEGEEYRNSLLSAIVDLPRIKRLATNPVMLTCLCVVHWNEGRLPEGRARVYKAVIRWLIASRTEQRNKAGFTDRFAVLAFVRLALHMMGASGKQTTIGLQEAAEAIEPALEREYPVLTKAERQTKGRQWLAFETEWSGIVEEIAGRRMKFWHLTFQEYLTARQIALLGDGEHSRDDWWPIVKEHLEDRQWSETIDMVPACLFEEGGETRVDRLFKRILDPGGPENGLQSVAHAVGLIGRLLVTLEPFEYRQDQKIAAAYQESREQVLAIFSNEGAGKVPEEKRVAAAEALGRAGDPRLDGIETSDRVENFYLPVPVPGGARLSKYLVTVHEFSKFHQDGGYDIEKFWDAVGWKIRQEEKWTAPGNWEEQLEILNKPVVEVSWYEASAYCRWLTARFSGTGFEARLPTGEEWEAAARRTGGYYPWGAEEPNSERANYYRKDSPNRPTPVGLYPAGAGPHKHLDLAGNVYEWSSDEHSQGDREPVFFLRGGCYWYDAEYLHVSYRGRYPARYRHGNLGFRVLLCPASTVT